MTKSTNDSSVNNHITNVAPDLQDKRDWSYQPALLNLKRFIDPPRNLHILNQKSEGACTGFGLAAVINYLNQQRGCMDKKASARMLYEMAKRYDEWDGEEYSGSSCRGAIKGWYNMGVAEDSFWRYVPNRPGQMTLDAAKNARSTTIGAYFRLKNRISDFHSAINEAGVVYCSASVHDGWSDENIDDDIISYKKEPKGGHAFAIVGYNDKGFWVQNSWGKEWGSDGLAIWTYEDWQKNIQDAWVLRLGLETPQVWHTSNDQNLSKEARIQAGKGPNRNEIAGHFVHVDDGEFHEKGKYWSTLNDVKITTKILEKSNKYDHLLIYFHGGLNKPTASANRIAAMKNVFKENRIYPYHFMYDTGLMEELKDVIFRKRSDADDRAKGFTSATDWLIEKLTRVPGRALWREMKRGARSPFNKPGAGTKVIDLFVNAISVNNKQRKIDGKKPLKIHLVGHSTGGIMAGWMLNRIKAVGIKAKVRISSATLLAPAATVDFYEDHYEPLINAPANQFGIDKLNIQCLNEKYEKDDTVGPYRKSLLYLVSRAFEEDKKEPILGMEVHHKKIKSHERLSLIYSSVDSKVSNSETHGGFDNDEQSMNSVLESVLAEKPKRPFTQDDLDY